MNTLRGDADTICALSTPPGVGGISVIRLSGDKALSIIQKHVKSLPRQPESHRIYFGLFNTSNHVAVDEVLVSYFTNGKSYTGEEVVEISCHGSPLLVSQILSNLNESGARLAARGEFTYRAFINGKMDLVQAESILSLIESQTQGAARLAMRQLSGETSKILAGVERELLLVLAHLEANIDFSQEDIVIETNSQLAQRVKGILSTVEGLLESYKSGRIVKEGIRVVLTGRPNAGKSSLLNKIIGQERAIVSPQPGTTRDFIESDFIHNGIRLTLVDTAGVREAADDIEKAGIDKTMTEATMADVVLWVFESKQILDEPELVFLRSISREKLILVLNKIDQVRSPQVCVESAAQQIGYEIQHFMTSAHTGQGIDQMLNTITSSINWSALETSPVLTNNRHRNLLLNVFESLKQGHKLLAEGASPELCALELHSTVQALYEILGKRFDDEIMDQVFSEFCLGK